MKEETEKKMNEEDKITLGKELQDLVWSYSDRLEPAEASLIMILISRQLACMHYNSFKEVEKFMSKASLHELKSHYKTIKSFKK